MEREDRGNNKKNETTTAEVGSKKWLSVVGFLVSITLLSLAIFLSINEENNSRIANLENYKSSQNMVQMASSDLSKNVNEVKQANQDNTVSNSINTSIATSNNQINIENSISTAVTNINDENQTEQTSTNTLDENQEENNSKESEVKQQFIKPVNGDIIKGYSMDSLVYSDTLQEWVTHKGIDINAEKGEEVKASASGTIKAIKNDPRFGLSVTIEHEGGFETIYSCLLSADNVEEGDTVEQGNIIGIVGNSGVFEVADGTHLHFEMLKDGDYINPEIYIK